MKWIKTIVLLMIIFLLSAVTPDHVIDPWGLFNLHKFFKLIWALMLIQVLGVCLARWLGPKPGSLVMGFLGGIISSTALTASLAKKSSEGNQKIPVEILPFLGATLAMLCEAFAIVLIGTDLFQRELVLIFVGPLIFTVVAIVRFYGVGSSSGPPVDLKEPVRFSTTIYLVLVIMAILAASKLIQILAGSSGLLFLTFLISLFEIHGSIVSNTQLFDAGQIDLSSYGLLLTLSIAASYFSKVLLVAVIGSRNFRNYVLLFTVAIVSSLAVSWLIFSHYSI